MNKRRSILFFSLLIAAVLTFFWANLVLGSFRISSYEAMCTLLGRGEDPMQASILFNIRLPRALAALLIGGALSLSGYLLQTFFMNPIVGPFVLGISSGAKLAVAALMIFSVYVGEELGLKEMVFAAFIGASLAMAVVLAASTKVRNISALLVCGIMNGYICSAITDFIVTFADDSNIVDLHNWSMGSFSGINWEEVQTLTVITVFGLLVSIALVKPMNAYRLGESYAASVGVNILALRAMLIFISSCLAAAAAAIAGPISFVGIAVPHLARTSLGTDRPSLMVFGSFFGGSAAALLCDLIARTLFAPTEVGISSVTAALLAPVVIAMMVGRGGRKGCVGAK